MFVWVHVDHQEDPNCREEVKLSSMHLMGFCQALAIIGMGLLLSFFHLNVGWHGFFWNVDHFGNLLFVADFIDQETYLSTFSVIVKFTPVQCMSLYVICVIVLTLYQYGPLPVSKIRDLSSIQWLLWSMFTVNRACEHLLSNCMGGWMGHIQCKFTFPMHGSCCP